MKSEFFLLNKMEKREVWEWSFSLGNQAFGPASHHLLSHQSSFGSVESERWQLRPRPHKDLTSGTIQKTKRAGDSLVRSVFVPLIVRRMCFGVTQGEAEGIWQWTMDEPHPNIHCVLGWNVSQFDKQRPNTPSFEPDPTFLHSSWTAQHSFTRESTTKKCSI